MKQGMRVSLAICVLVVAVSSACAQMPQPFSADMSTTIAKGDKATGKLYFSPPKMRMDINSHGHDAIVISDSRTQTSQMLMPQQHMYLEMRAGQSSPLGPSLPKFDTAVDPSNPCSAHPDVTCKKAGTETVNGRVCDKWEMADKKTGTSTMWLDQKLHFPIKTVNADGATVEFSNIKEGAPDASLFQVPAGYRKMEIPTMGGGRPPQ